MGGDAFKKLLKNSKECLTREQKRKLKKIKDDKERLVSLKYILVSQLKLKYLEIDSFLHKKKKIVNKLDLSTKSKLHSLPHKITYLNEHFKEKDFKKIFSLLEEIERDIQDV